MTPSKAFASRTLTPPQLPEKVAAELLLRFLRDPFSSSSEPRLSELSSDERVALESLTRSLGVSVEAMVGSENERVRVRNALVHGLSLGPMSPARAEAARGRLGNAGLLAPSEYQLEFPDILKSSENLGDRRVYIETAIRQADAVQHLSPTGKTDAGSQEGISLFVRKVARSNAKDFAHLVIMSRAKSRLRFQAAWRIYSDVVPWDGGMSPLDLLRKFVDRFGMPFSIPGRPPTKFLLYDVIPWRGPNTSQALMKTLFNPSSTTHDFSAQFSVKVNEVVGVVEVSLGYVIDTTNYKAYLKNP